MTCHVELVYDVGCPHVNGAREVLLLACARAGVAASWREWDRKSPECPARIRGYGSPTILVNGQDVAGAEPGQGKTPAGSTPMAHTAFVASRRWARS